MILLGKVRVVDRRMACNTLSVGCTYINIEERANDN